MRLLSCTWVSCAVTLTFLTQCTTPLDRHYYIAAVNINWDYKTNGNIRTGQIYKKAVYKEYDSDFKHVKTTPSSTGLLGPTLRGQEGDTIIVTFRNMVDHPCTIHTHGIAYGKQSEGSLYFDNTSEFEKEDDAIFPGGEHTYLWEVTPEVAPKAADPPCVTYTYFSHYDIVKDYNTGLIGTMLICKKGSLDDSGKQIYFHQELTLLFGVFDENNSWYSRGGPPLKENVKYTINGFSNGSVPDLSVCTHSRVTWYLLGMSSEPELFSVHFSGQVVQESGHKVSSVGIVSGTATCAEMVAVYPGRWLFSSHISKHLEAGMHGFLTANMCEEFTAPKRRLTIQQSRDSREWTYYIAAEEVVWDYAPNLPDKVDGNFRFTYLKQSAERIGKKYKKAVFTQYKDATFKEKVPQKQRKKELGILGPVIRAQIRDVVKIVFKNKASHPYSIYPHGLSISKTEEGANYPEGGNHSHAVQPGETYTYVWPVNEEDEPLDGDSRCVTRMYHSAVNTPRDIASGLIGPLLICKSQSLNTRNVQVRADKEQHAVFTIFDENKSWYIEENINTYCGDPKRVKIDDPEFYKSNIMHTINGYVYESGQTLGFCNGEIVTWHVSSVGDQDDIQTATFYGHTFVLNNREEDILSLFPMTGETISMNMANTGVWLLASLSTHETNKGLRIKFRDVECYREYIKESDYNYDDEEDNDSEDKDETFAVWQPAKINKEETKPAKKNVVEIDQETDNYAAFLGLRTIKNTGNGTSDAEELDLSFLDHDEGVLTENSSPSLKDETKNTTNSKVEYSTKFQMNDSVLASKDTFVEVNFIRKDVENKSTLEAEFIFNITLEQAASEDSHNTSLKARKDMPHVPNQTADKKQNVTNTQTEELTTTVESEESSDKLNNTFICSVPDCNSPVNIADVEEFEVLVLLSSDNEEEIGNEPFIEYVISPTALPNNTNMEMLENITDSKDKELNKTSVNSESLEEMDNETEYNISIKAFASNTFEAPPENVFTNDSLELSYKEDSKTEEFKSTHMFLKILSMIFIGSGNFFVNKHLETTNSPQNVESTESLTYSGGNEITQSGSQVSKDWNSSEEFSSENSKNHSLSRGISMLLTPESFQNTTPAPRSDLAVTEVSVSRTDTLAPSNSSEKNMSETTESREEVVIYLKNVTEAILTTSLNPQGGNWSYETQHTLVPNEISDSINKYILDERVSQPNITKEDKKKKIILKKVSPMKGYGMKTKKRKEYVPQHQNAISPRSFSPRGFGLQPKGTRPVSGEEDMLTKPIIIGLPRRDFNDYELYVPNQDFEFEDIKDNSEEYEYVEYNDPYRKQADIQEVVLEKTSNNWQQSAGNKARVYFITAEEVNWDYAGYGQRREASQKERPTVFKKVLFREYLDSSFTTPYIRGETDEHLGILGPVIKAEIDETIYIVFRNLASHPFSLHANGVSYGKNMEGLKYDDDSPYWYEQDDAVQPNTTFTYMWTVNAKVGPIKEESDCRIWAYYSGVNAERDIHSGLIGPLLVCRKGTLDKRPTDSRDFMLLFMTFDESKSWYFENNQEMFEKTNKKAAMDPDFNKNIKFHAINGIIYSLKGLRMYTNQLVKWHLLNMGSSKDLHSVHFHGQTFLNKQSHDHRQGVFPLLPGGFATLEMTPSKPGLWLLESEIGISQQSGMQTLFLVLDNVCDHPLGLISGMVKDSQITASEYTGYWLPSLARLHNTGKYNAWSTTNSGQWIQVDFQRPVVISKVATQGAKRFFTSHFMLNFTVSYSTDRKRWIFYKGDSKAPRKVFEGNKEAHEVKENTFSPPIIGRFVRLYPSYSYNNPTVRMEFYGCELDGCSVPLGMENGHIKDNQITASSVASSWYAGSWQPWFARLNKQGTVNAWQAKTNDMQPWLQIELKVVKKITGIVTQGAKTLNTDMFVTTYLLEYSNDGKSWTKYTDDEDYEQKIFMGNSDNNHQVKNYIYPPIFSKFIRIIPKHWQNSVTIRIELLGCDFE